MKLLLIISLLFSFAATAQPAFKKGTYNPGDEVISSNKVYVNIKACKACSAFPFNSPGYWKEKKLVTGPVITLDSLLKRIMAIEAMLPKKSDYKDGTLMPMMAIYTDSTIILDTIKGFLKYTPKKYR